MAARVDVAVALTGDLESELRRLGFHKPVWLIPNSRRPERFPTSTEAHRRLGCVASWTWTQTCP